MLGFNGMWIDFVDALEKRRAPSMTLDQAQRDLEIIEEAYRDGSAAR
jgi:hypothetical protein